MTIGESEGSSRRRARARHRRARGRRAASLAIAAAVLVAAVIAWAAGAMSSGGQPGSVTATPRVTSATPDVGGTGGRASSAEPCDPIEPSRYCLLPFPDNYFTQPDAESRTGIEVNLPAAAMPANVKGVHIDPTAWDQSDGFSPGSEVVTQMPGVDLQRSGAPSITDYFTSLSQRSPIVIIDASTGRRQPFFAELDANAANLPGQQSLILRPTVNFEMGHRYIVALRSLRDGSGAVIPANPAFASLRDATCAGASAQLAPALAAEQPRYQNIFSTLGRAGVRCRNLQLAWDFTVASRHNVDGRMLDIRNAAFSELGSAAPSFQLSSVINYTPTESPYLARQVTGTFDVPSFLNKPGGPPGSSFNYQGSSAGEPSQLPGNVQVANFICDIPHSVVADPTNATDSAYPGHASLYGHGLFGSASELGSLDVQEFADSQHFVLCATDEIGLSDQDLSEMGQVFENLSLFPTVPDRLQQGLLDELFLGRLMTSASGFDASPAFRGGAGDVGLIDGSQLSYLGYSLGGILGGALTAVSPEFTRSVLGVPGMNFSTFMDRSTDAEDLLRTLDLSYPDKVDQQLILSLIQMLWDRGESDGYAQSMTDHPLPGTPQHRVLIEEAFGDHQVPNLMTETEARTIGAAASRPALPSGVTTSDPFAGLATLPAPTYQGSAIVMWYTPGQAPTPLTNTPPTAGHDPHEDQRLDPAAQLQEGTFLATGQIVDVCGGQPCVTAPNTPGSQ